MWNLLKKNGSDCTRFQEKLDAAAKLADGNGSVETLLAVLPTAQQTHATVCSDCLSAAEELLVARSLLRKLPSHAAIAGPWFAARVMTAIAAREVELRHAASTWIAVPRLASRFAVACGALLIVVSTWLYQKPTSRPAGQTSPSATSAPEYLFEQPAAPMTQDDVFISLAEDSQ
jgi:hypothetical protein